MKIPLTTLLLSSALGVVGAFSTGCSRTAARSSSTSLNAEVPSTRRSWLQSSASVLLGSVIASASSPQVAFAKTATDASSLDPDLPNDAIKSYLQYRYSLQLAADYYMFDLQDMVADTGEIMSSTSLNAEVPSTRRSWLQSSASVLLGSVIASASSPQVAFAKTATDASSLDPDLPNDAIKSYLQYRYSLQLAADYYMFDLQDMVADTGEIILVMCLCCINVYIVLLIFSS